ncbi:hypothetical protein AM2010_2500 [Pelagerythrobacter marensis]|uniref:Uncharacterized protein n=1 Tax=Pelagerythrobacter marensis TaxID=543877 RepID=A0A0G3XAK7_9SPHN|nr:hypothetical protein AM2010_2500 [Pelagerythrobacter marensis]
MLLLGAMTGGVLLLLVTSELIEPSTAQASVILAFLLGSLAGG